MADLNIRIGDVIRTSYETGPYRVESVHRYPPSETRNHWDREITHRQPERISLCLSSTVEPPHRNKAGEVSRNDLYYVNDIYAGGPDDYPVGHGPDECAALAAGVASGRYGKASHPHVYVLERGTAPLPPVGEQARGQQMALGLEVAR